MSFSMFFARIGDISSFPFAEVGGLVRLMNL
jgi:hypothetical protein